MTTPNTSLKRTATRGALVRGMSSLACGVGIGAGVPGESRWGFVAPFHANAPALSGGAANALFASLCAPVHTGG
jgi:hypothetical protein